MLRAGAASLEITPFVGGPMAGYADRTGGSVSVRDPLRAEALVLDGGRGSCAIVTADLIGFDASTSAAVRAAVQRRCGIVPERVMLAGTHTHWGPELREMRLAPETPLRAEHEAYLIMLTERIAEAVQRACERLRPARAGAASISAAGLAFNRRIVTNGTCEMAFRLPPEQLARATGPVDPELSVLRIADSSGGESIATLLNFGCHPVCSTDRPGELSADYPGHAKRLIERELGGVALFALGCAGDVVPARRGGDAALELGRAVGGLALRALAGLETGGEHALDCARRMLDLPLRDLASAQEPERVRRFFPEWAGKRERTVELQAFRLGPWPIVALPGEILAASGLDLKRRLAASPAFTLTMANTSAGYFPRRESFSEGGYEPTVSCFEPGSAERLIDEAGALAGELGAE
ncbi:MAG: hypothetical protein AMXMBFR7_35920 [Planctomycetota bacterium]